LHELYHQPWLLLLPLLLLATGLIAGFCSTQAGSMQQ
jgi:hypothetical protein